MAMKGKGQSGQAIHIYFRHFHRLSLSCSHYNGHQPLKQCVAIIRPKYVIADSVNASWALTAGEKLQFAETLPFGIDSFLLES